MMHDEHKRVRASAAQGLYETLACAQPRGKAKIPHHLRYKGIFAAGFSLARYEWRLGDFMKFWVGLG